MEQAGIQLIAQDVNVYIGDLGRATSATNTFVDATDRGGGRVSKAGEIMTGALRHIGTIAVEAFAKAAQATAAFIGDSISLAGDFEQGMLNFQAVAGRDVDTQGLEDFRDLFIDIGKRLPVSTSDVQAAATEMVKGGIDPAIIAAGGLERNIQFAAAAMDGDLVKAAEISSKVLGGWTSATDSAATKADFLTHSTDLLSKAANASATDVEGLSRGIFNAQGIAKTAGVGFGDLTTTLALLAPRFASSSEAGTSLKNVIARLQPTTDPAIQAMASLGLYTAETGSAFYDAQGNFVGFEETSRLLQESLAGLTKEQQASLLQTIFGNDAMSAAAALADGGAEAYRAMAEAMASANGVMDTAALKQQGFETSLENTKGSLEALQITIGSALLPILGTLLDDYITPGINRLIDFAEALTGDQEAFQKLAPEVQAVIKWFDAAGDSTIDLGTTLDDLRGIWDQLLLTAGDVLGGYQAIAQSVLPIITQFIDDHGSEIQAFFKATWDAIVQIVTLALEIYRTIVPPILHAIADFISDHGSEIQKIFSGVWTAISSIVTGALETIKGVLKLALDVMHGDWDAAWEDIKAIGKAQWDAITGFLDGALNAIAGLFDTTLEEIGQTWADNWNSMVDLIGDIGWWEAGKLIVEGLQQGINDAWSSLMRWFTDKVASLVDAAMEAIGAASPAKEFMPVGQFAVQGIMQGFSDNWGGLTDLVGSLSGDLIGSMRDIGSQMQSAIADSFGATASIDRQVAKNLDRLAKDVLPEYASYTAGALKQVQDEAAAFLDPAEGARFFKLRSDQILEYAALQKKLSETQNAEDRARIQQQMLLINRAQTAEISQFNATAQAQNPLLTIADQVNEVMRAISGINLTDDQIRIVDMLASVWSGLQSPISTRAQQYANPPQTQYPSTSTQSTTTNQTVNMPIYTNNSAAALQQSWAILQASMP